MVFVEVSYQMVPPCSISIMALIKKPKNTLQPEMEEIVTLAAVLLSPRCIEANK